MLHGLEKIGLHLFWHAVVNLSIDRCFHIFFKIVVDDFVENDAFESILYNQSLKDKKGCVCIFLRRAVQICHSVEVDLA